MKPQKVILHLGVLLISFLGISQNNHLFEKGKDHYRDGEYQNAIVAWEEILTHNEASANLYFNLGNAYYKQQQIGPAIYYYEKALQYAPNDSEIKNNLSFAENARIDIIEPLPQSVFSKWYQNVIGLFSYDGWAILSIIGSLGFVALFLSYYFSHRERIKRIFFVAASIFLIVMGVSFAMASLSHRQAERDRPAIIFAEEVEVKSEPSLSSSTIFQLHEGTKVQIIAEDGDWYRIRLADGKDGWLTAQKVKTL